MAKLWRKLKWLVFFLGHGVYVFLKTVCKLFVENNHPTHIPQDIWA